MSDAPYQLAQSTTGGKWHRVTLDGKYIACNGALKPLSPYQGVFGSRVAARLIAMRRGFDLCSRCWDSHMAYVTPAVAEEVAKATGGTMPDTFFELNRNCTVGDLEVLGIQMGISSEEAFAAFWAWRKSRLDVKLR